MKTVAVILVCAFALTSCGLVQKSQAHWMGHTKVCVDGVTYIQFPTGTVVQRDTSDKIVPCS